MNKCESTIKGILELSVEKLKQKRVTINYAKQDILDMDFWKL